MDCSDKSGPDARRRSCLGGHSVRLDTACEKMLLKQGAGTLETNGDIYDIVQFRKRRRRGGSAREGLKLRSQHLLETRDEDAHP